MTKSQFMLIARDYFRNNRVTVTDFHRVLEFPDLTYADIDDVSSNGNVCQFNGEKNSLFYAEKIELLLPVNGDARFNVLVTKKYGVDTDISKMGQIKSVNDALSTLIHCREWCYRVAQEEYGYQCPVGFPDGFETIDETDVLNTRAVMLPNHQRNVFNDVIFENFLVMSKHTTNAPFAVGSSGKVLVRGFMANNF